MSDSANHHFHQAAAAVGTQILERCRLKASLSDPARVCSVLAQYGSEESRRSGKHFVFAKATDFFNAMDALTSYRPRIPILVDTGEFYAFFCEGCLAVYYELHFGPARAGGWDVFGESDLRSDY